MWIIYLILAIFILLIFAPLILGIPIVYLTIKQYAVHNIKKCNDNELPDDCRAYFLKQGFELAKLGFENRSYYIHENIDSANNVGYAMVMLSFKTQTRVAVYHLINKNIKVNYVEFSSKFTDGYAIVTYNPDISSPFILPKNIYMQQVKSTDINELFTRHLSTVEKLKGNRIFSDLNTLDYITEANQDNKEILDYQVQKRLMKTCDNATAYRPTLIGAIIFTFKEWIRFKFLKIK